MSSELAALTPYAPHAAVAAIALVLGLVLGRAGSKTRRRLHELESQVEVAHKEQEQLRSELGAARDVLREREQEHHVYRDQVTDHFAGTAEQFRELTVQYRALYERLSQGAGALCPDAFTELSGGFEALAAESDGDLTAELLETDEAPERE